MARKKKLAVSQGEILSVLKSLMGEHWGFIAFLFVVYVVAFGLEGLGFSLLIPLLQAIISPDANVEGSGAFIQLLLKVKDLFPEENRLVGLLGLLTGLFFFKSMVVLFSAGVTRWFIDTLRMEWMTRVFRNYLLAPFSTVAMEPKGVIVENTVNQTHDCAKGIFLVVDLMARCVQIVVFSVFLLLTNWQVTLIIICVGGVLFGLTWKKSQNYSHGAGKKRQKIRQRSSEVVAETVSGLRSIKLLNLQEERVSKIRHLQRKYRYVDSSFETFSAIPNSLLDFVAILIGGTAIFYMLYVAQIPAEEVVPMTALIGVLFLRLASAASYLFSRRVKIVMAYASIKLVYDMLRMETEHAASGEPFEKLTSDIVFKDIFLHPKGRRIIHDNLNFTIPQKGLTGIVGPSGSGKTTLIDMLVGLRKPEKGSVLINGHDLNYYNINTIRAKVGHLPQDPQLFNLSIADNMRLADPTASEDQLIEVAKRAHVHEFVSQMEAGYQTELGDGALTLSGGQRQRLALARELLKKPELFIFDEPTSALDPDSQKLIKGLIHELAQDYPVIVITHNIDLVNDAVQVLLLKDGSLSVQRDTNDKKH